MEHVAIFCSKDTAAYGFGDDHPFGPDRQDAFLAEFKARGLDRDVLMLPAHPANRLDVELFHGGDYLDFLRDRCARDGGYLDMGDTPALSHIPAAAHAVVGAALRAAEMLVEGSLAAAFLPIGGLHHAGRDHAAGFCALSDIGVVIEKLRSHYGLKRILYVDIDAHHGDGVFYAYEDDPDVWIVDTHQEAATLYPGTGHAHERGTGEAEGTKLNLPLPAGADSAAFRAAWAEAAPFMEKAAPDFIIFQCGADSVAGDPITQLAFEPADHGFAARELMALAAKHCPGRILGLGGGGYNRANLAAAWNEVVAAMLAASRKAAAAG
ncbi:MAG: acetoin utilization protein AcuC [Gammaproteobacteria bacterium]|nr:acetoin utilization protein AcuC [Gammaproteobacteria bacterium]